MWCACAHARWEQLLLRHGASDSASQPHLRLFREESQSAKAKVVFPRLAGRTGDFAAESFRAAATTSAADRFPVQPFLRSACWASVGRRKVYSSGRRPQTSPASVSNRSAHGTRRRLEAALSAYNTACFAVSTHSCAVVHPWLHHAALCRPHLHHKYGGTESGACSEKLFISVDVNFHFIMILRVVSLD